MSTAPHLSDLHRSLPHSLEAEKGLLSSMLLNPADVCPMVEDLPVDALFLSAHQIVFTLLLDRWRAGEAVDIVLLTSSLRHRGALDEVGGAAFITELFGYVPTSSLAGFYLQDIRKAAANRRVIGAGPETELAYEAGADPEELADRLENAAREVRALASDGSALRVRTKDVVMDAIAAIERAYERKGALPGLATGFTALDRLTGGLHSAELTVIAARPSMGKTALGMNIAEHVAVKLRRGVIVFSLEMSREQLVQRMLCSRARVNLQKIRDGFLGERDFPSLTNAASNLAAAPIEIDDASALSILDLRARARRLAKLLEKDGSPLSLVVVDYLQLLRSPSKRSQENRQVEVAEISGGLKSLAKELAVPVVCLAQLNRNPEGRGGASAGRPRLSDLRESGAIEQDADNVGLLFRPEYYAENDADKETERGKALLIIAKQRNGPVDDVELTFVKEYARFEDRA